MASSRSSWCWGSLRPWQTPHSRLSENDERWNSPVDIWNCLDEMMGGSPYRGPSHPETAHLRFILDNHEEFRRHGGFMDTMDTRIRDWIASRSLEMDERPPRPIDTRAVFNKCRREVYKPKSRGGPRGKSAAEQDDCPVCLEKFVADQDLYSLPCNHKFHKDCLTPWIQSNHGDCPCCRADILKTKSKLPSSTTPPAAAAASIPGRLQHRPSSSSSSSSSNGRSGRREADDIMTVLAAMEAALDRLGLSSTY